MKPMIALDGCKVLLSEGCAQSGTVGYAAICETNRLPDGKIKLINNILEIA